MEPAGCQLALHPPVACFTDHEIPQLLLCRNFIIHLKVDPCSPQCCLHVRGTLPEKWRSGRSMMLPQMNHCFIKQPPPSLIVHRSVRDIPADHHALPKLLEACCPKPEKEIPRATMACVSIHVGVGLPLPIQPVVPSQAVGSQINTECAIRPTAPIGR